MIEVVNVPIEHTLDDYTTYLYLREAVRDLTSAAGTMASGLNGRTVWMVNSTAQGGGVAEMMPGVISLLRQLGVHVEWATITPDDTRFFRLTKHLHNLLHGTGDPHLSKDDEELYTAVSQQLAGEFRDRLQPDDLLVIHDPQPLGMGAILKRELHVRALWRCHIGLGEETAETRAGWQFLEPWAKAYDRAIFSLEAYIPSFLRGNAEVMYPTIDPLSDKNRELWTHDLTNILTSAALLATTHPTVSPPYEHPALRLQIDGSYAPAIMPEDIGLLFRPIVIQISRWDRLKGFAPLLQGFARLKNERQSRRYSHAQRRQIDLARLVLAGPDPRGVQDDPEAQEVVKSISAIWQSLDDDLQRDIAILMLPMQSAEQNALMVNALQRCASLVAQNSVREGFGLTVTEAMWKARPILGSSAVGIRAQIRDGVDGTLIANPEDPAEIAERLATMLGDDSARERWGRNAQDRADENFLVFSQVRRWLEVLSQAAKAPQRAEVAS